MQHWQTTHVLLCSIARLLMSNFSALTDHWSSILQDCQITDDDVQFCSIHRLLMPIFAALPNHLCPILQHCQITDAQSFSTDRLITYVQFCSTDRLITYVQFLQHCQLQLAWQFLPKHRKWQALLETEIKMSTFNKQQQQKNRHLRALQNVSTFLSVLVFKATPRQYLFNISWRPSICVWLCYLLVETKQRGTTGKQTSLFPCTHRKHLLIPIKKNPSITNRTFPFICIKHQVTLKKVSLGKLSPLYFA